MERFIKTMNELYFKSCQIKYENLAKKRLDNPWLTSHIHQLIQIQLKSLYFKLFKVGTITKEENNLSKNKSKFIIDKK